MIFEGVFIKFGYLKEPVAPRYDANGNLLSDGVCTYIWNARDQFVDIKQRTASIASFCYGPLGRRLGKTEGGQTISCLYDGLDAVQET
ncbi:hypothetical protein ACM9XA_02480 [Xanthomonas sacchari]